VDQGSLVPVSAGLPANLDTPLSAYPPLRLRPDAVLRYHSFVVLPDSAIDDLKVTPRAEDGEVMVER
jgi:hypothetical protein